MFPEAVSLVSDKFLFVEAIKPTSLPARIAWELLTIPAGTRYATCSVVSCSHSSRQTVSCYYNGSLCSSFSGVNCAGEYQVRGQACQAQCDVDSWRGCCEDCQGAF